jgi:hypothetical protein
MGCGDDKSRQDAGTTLSRDIGRIRAIAEKTLKIAAPAVDRGDVVPGVESCLDADGRFAEVGTNWSTPVNSADFERIEEEVRSMWLAQGIQIDQPVIRVSTQMQLFGDDGDFGVTVQLDAARGFVYFGVSRVKVFETGQGCG